MFLFPMADFMREHCQYFFRRMRSQQRVKQNNALGSADTGKIGVGMFGAFALINLINSFGL